MQLVSTDNPKVNGDYIINFLQKLKAETPNKEKIYLICDDAGYHKSKKAKEYLGRVINLTKLQKQQDELPPKSFEQSYRNALQLLDIV